VDQLRWVLLLAGALVLAGLFLWSRYRARLGESFRRRVPEQLLRPTRLEPSLEGTGIELDGPKPSAAPDLPLKIVTIRLLCRDKHGFPGEDLVLALRQAGLRHGRYGIFHRLEADDEDATVFSVASLTEPGSFDLAGLRTSHYPGVSIFLGLPGPIDGVAAFDAMIQTARRIGASLGGEIVDEQGSTLSVQRERYLREEVIQFQHRQARP